MSAGGCCVAASLTRLRAGAAARSNRCAAAAAASSSFLSGTYAVHPPPRPFSSSSSSSSSPSSSSSYQRPISNSRWAERRGKPHGSRAGAQPPGAPLPAGPLRFARSVPPHILRPPYARGLPIPPYPEPQIQATEQERDAMRRAGEVAARVLALCAEKAAGTFSSAAAAAAGSSGRGGGGGGGGGVAGLGGGADTAGPAAWEGATTDDVDALVHEACVREGHYPSPLGYSGFPRSVCTSVNEVVCHGIPSARAELRRGDILKIDVSVFVAGVHGDTCRTFVVGGRDGDYEADAAAGPGPGGDPGAAFLVRETRRMLDASVAICGPGVPVRDVGALISKMCDEARLESVTAFSGHGVGAVFHSNPIVHHRANDSPYVMRPGMTFTIEPMITEGTAEVGMWPDGWGVVTADGGRSAQFEHTLMVTEHGVEVLTRY